MQKAHNQCIGSILVHYTKPQAVQYSISIGNWCQCIQKKLKKSSYVNTEQTNPKKHIFLRCLGYCIIS